MTALIPHHLHVPSCLSRCHVCSLSLRFPVSSLYSPPVLPPRVPISLPPPARGCGAARVAVPQRNHLTRRPAAEIVEGHRRPHLALDLGADAEAERRLPGGRGGAGARALAGWGGTASQRTYCYSPLATTHLLQLGNLQFGTASQRARALMWLAPTEAAALAPVVETGESEDVGTRVRLHCDGTGLCRAQIWRSGTHARKQ